MLASLLDNKKTAQLHRVANGHHGAYGKAWEGTEQVVLDYLKQHL